MATYIDAKFTENNLQLLLINIFAILAGYGFYKPDLVLVGFKLWVLVLDILSKLFNQWYRSTKELTLNFNKWFVIHQKSDDQIH